jgi:hypothetical protein
LGKECKYPNLPLEIKKEARINLNTVAKKISCGECGNTKYN